MQMTSQWGMQMLAVQDEKKTLAERQVHLLSEGRVIFCFSLMKSDVLQQDDAVGSSHLKFQSIISGVNHEGKRIAVRFVNLYIYLSNTNSKCKGETTFRCRQGVCTWASTLSPTQSAGHATGSSSSSPRQPPMLPILIDSTTSPFGRPAWVHKITCVHVSVKGGKNKLSILKISTVAM